MNRAKSKNLEGRAENRSRNKVSKRASDLLGGTLGPIRNKSVEEQLEFSLNLKGFGREPKGLHTFENFVVDPKNRRSFKLAKIVAEHPGEILNPLIICGQEGVGATHMMLAIKQAIEHRPKSAVACFSSPLLFMNDLRPALEESSGNGFEKNLTGFNLVCIDDVDRMFLGDGEPEGAANPGSSAAERKMGKFGEEFISTIQEICASGRQIVMTCDAVCKETAMKYFPKKVIEILPPGLKSRLEILSGLEKSSGLQIPEEIKRLLATRIQSDVWRLRQAFEHQARNIGWTLADCDRFYPQLQPSVKTKSRQVSVKCIAKRVAQYFQITLADMKGGGRRGDITLPRHLTMFFARQTKLHSLRQIGDEFGREPSSVLRACDSITDRLTTDKTLQRTVKELEELLSRPSALTDGGREE